MAWYTVQHSKHDTFETHAGYSFHGLRWIWCQAGRTLQTLGGSRLVMTAMAGLETQGIRWKDWDGIDDQWHLWNERKLNGWDRFVSSRVAGGVQTLWITEIWLFPFVTGSLLYPTTSMYLSTCKFTVCSFAVAIAPCIVNAHLMRALQDKIALKSSLAETGRALALAHYQ